MLLPFTVDMTTTMAVSYTHLRLYRMYDKIEDEESQMIEARAKRQAIEAEKLTGDNIYKVLMCLCPITSDRVVGANFNAKGLFIISPSLFYQKNVRF